MHGRFRIGLSKIHRRFCIGPPKIYRWFRIGPPQVSLNFLPPEFHERGIMMTIIIMKEKQQKNLFEIEWRICVVVGNLDRRSHVQLFVISLKHERHILVIYG